MYSWVTRQLEGPPEITDPEFKKPINPAVHIPSVTFDCAEGGAEQVRASFTGLGFIRVYRNTKRYRNGSGGYVS